MVTATRVRLASAAFLIAGVLFTAYPALRPFSDEVGLSGAAAFGSQAWIVAHVLAIFAFVLVVLGLLGVWLRLASTRAERAAFVGLVLSWMGAGLLLPFYGAEVFGLHAIGQAALARSDPSLVTLADAVRGEPGIWFILLGLALLAIGVITAAVAMWRSGIFKKWIALPLALGFALYIPQFAAAQSVRVAHGVLIMVGCVLIAWDIIRSNGTVLRGR